MYHKAFKCVVAKVRKCHVGNYLQTKVASMYASRQAIPESREQKGSQSKLNDEST